MKNWNCPESPSAVRRLFDRISTYYDFANQVLSLGLHHAWRRRLLSSLPTGQIRTALDVCTGTGALLGGLGRQGGLVCGLDFSRQMMNHVCKAGQRTNVRLTQGDALRLPFAANSFDITTASFGVRSFTDLQAGLKEMQRVLKPGGTMAVLEFGRPESRWWRWAFSTYARVVIPLLGGAISGTGKAYRYLTDTVLSFPCGDDFCEVVTLAGFERADFKPLSGGIVYLYLARKPMEPSQFS